MHVSDTQKASSFTDNKIYIPGINVVGWYFIKKIFGYKIGSDMHYFLSLNDYI